MRSSTLVLHFLLLLPVASFPLQAGAPGVMHEFAQVGAGGGVRTIVLVLNSTDEAASLQLNLYADDGSPLALTINGLEASQFEQQVLAGASVRIEISSAGALPMAGWARLTASVPVAAQMLFEIVSGETLVTQAAVEAITPLDHAELFVDTTSGLTGIAIANVSDSTTIRVRLILRDEGGQELATTDFELPPHGHLAQFIPQLFPSTGSLRGTIKLVTTGWVALVTLQQSGLVLGTLPVVLPGLQGG